MGGFAEYQNRYPALICTIDPKKVEGYTEKVDDSTGGGESGVVTQVKEGESQEQSKTDESSPTEQWAGIVKKTTHAHLSTMGYVIVSCSLIDLTHIYWHTYMRLLPLV